MTRRSGGPPSQRQLRVGEELRHVLVRILGRGQLRDPDLDGVQVTVTEVHVSPDLRNATAFVVPFGGGQADTLVAALNRAAGFFRAQFGRELKLRYIPGIRFQPDRTFEHAKRIDQLLHDPRVTLDLGRGDESDGDRATAVARKQRGIPIHGWLVIDKPVGMSSMQVVSRVRRATGAAKAGHAGTLDPLASGVLPVALGEATKTVPFVTGGRKRYRFTLRWGEARATDDAEGEVVATSAVRPTPEQIGAVLERMTGTIEQVPPAFSAIHIEGQRAYALARAGHKVEPAPRMVTVHRFALVERPDDDHAVFEVECGKGTYIRSLARDLAVALGTVGHVSALRRTAVEPFTEAQAISLESLQTLGHSPAAFGQLLPVETALDDIPALALTDTEANRLRCGQPVGFLSRQDQIRIGHLESGCIVCAMAGGKPVALARFEAGDLHAVRVLNF